MSNLTLESIKQLSNEKSYTRGEKYYKAGRVTEYKDQSNILTAKVIGTDMYNVRVDLNTLDNQCNCLAFYGDELCKHQIAVLLTKIYGEVVSNSKVKIKGQKTQQIIKAGKEPKLQIEKLDKEKLVQLLQELINEYEFIEDFISTRINPLSEFDYSSFESKFKNLFKGVKLGYNWDYYSNQLDNVYEGGVDLVKYLPTTNESCKLLLKLAYWIDNKLSSLDDSDGIIQNLQDELISKAMHGLEEEVITLSDIYSFTSRDSNFDYATKIIESILLNVQNKEILGSIFQKLEKTLFKSDPDFGKANVYMKNIFFHFLAKFDSEKFESLAVDFYKEDNGIKKDLLEHYFQVGKYKEFVDLIWPPDHLYFWGHENLEKSLIKLNDTIKLKQLYITLIKDGYSKTYIGKLYDLVLGEQGVGEWKKIRDSLIQKIGNIDRQVDMYLITKDYEKVVELLVSIQEEDQRLSGRSSVEEITYSTAIKFTIISPRHAVLLLRFLFAKEFKKLEGRKTNYDYLLLILEKLLQLKDDKYISEQVAYIFTNLPNRKKLVERVKRLLRSSSQGQV
jgi:hypothetical protein